MWFANNRPVEEHALALLAKCVERYRVVIYAFGLEGTHDHTPAMFPLKNRGHFTRDFNSGVACAVARLTPGYTGGPLWERRYSGEYLWENNDIERQFFYTVLQPVKDGLVEKISEYPFYNCFYDAVRGYERKFKLVNWTNYNEARRNGKDVEVSEFTETYTLKYERLPGYENLSSREYQLLMEKKLEIYRQEILKERIAEGKFHFVGRKALLQMKPGTRAVNPKLSSRNNFRPRVIARGQGQYEKALKWYYWHYHEYKKASLRYLAGDLLYEFPPECTGRRLLHYIYR